MFKKSTTSVKTEIRHRPNNTKGRMAETFMPKFLIFCAANLVSSHICHTTLDVDPVTIFTHSRHDRGGGRTAHFSLGSMCTSNSSPTASPFNRTATAATPRPFQAISPPIWIIDDLEATSFCVSRSTIVFARFRSVTCDTRARSWFALGKVGYASLRSSQIASNGTMLLFCHNHGIHSI